MTAQGSSANVTVTLAGPLLQFAEGPTELRAACEASLGAVSRLLGLPFTAVVAVEGDKHRRRPLTVAVQGRALDTPRFLDRQVLASRGAPGVTDPGNTPSPWEAARDAGADLLNAVVDIVEQTVVAQPSCLVGEVELDQWCADAGTERSTAVETAVVRAVDLRISIADHDALHAAMTDSLEPADLAERVVEILRPTTLEIVVEPRHLEDVTAGTADEVGQMLPYLRESIYTELGVRMPDLRIVEDATMPPLSFRFRVNNLLTPPFLSFSSDFRLINATPDQLREVIPGANVSPSCILEAGSAIIPATSEQLAQSMNYTTWSPLGHLVFALANVVRQNAAAFVDQRVVSDELGRVRLLRPELAPLAEAAISVPRLTRLLRALVSEGISIRNLPHYLQSVVDLAANGMLDGSEATLLARTRTLSARGITAHAMKNGESVVAYLLDPDLEAAAVAAELTETTDDDDELRRVVLDALDDELATLPPTATVPVLLATSSARQPIRNAIRTAWPQMTVVAYDELIPAANVMPVARISAKPAS
jgi:flagellar biosynthesis component FlhA